MKRMSQLKDNLRGIQCAGTKECFNLLKKNKRRPRIVETPTALYVRVTIDGKQYDYSGTTGKWTLTRDRGRSGEWRASETPADFYESACRWSDGVRPPSSAQVDYVKSLAKQTRCKVKPETFLSAQKCSDLIGALKRIKEAREVAA